MPTPVDAARQCLTQESVVVLDEAVSVSRRRGHAQTTSLHMLSSLLSRPNSCLREACIRVRNNGYSARMQLKALELSLSVSLDHLPSTARVEEPPVSNSLMAAIKRSQSNQRRQPESFVFHQQYSMASAVSVVKVELPILVLSILDDPLVSRVFGEAGFRSFDVKMATLRLGSDFRPPHWLYYPSRYKQRNPPLFSCNLSSSGIGGKGYRFPFLGCFSGDENSKGITDIMLRSNRRNPLLVGVYAGDALITFMETLKTNIGGVLPVGLTGLRAVCLKDDILRFETDEGSLKLRFKEIEGILDGTSGSGVVVNLGDLAAFAGDLLSDDGLRYLVENLAGLLKDHGGRIWLIGTAATYEVYYKILYRIPSIEKECELEILPIINSFKFSMTGSYQRSSLMESFVPLGGFFSMPSDPKGSIRSFCQQRDQLQLDDKKPIFPSLLQINEQNLAAVKDEDHSLLLDAKTAEVEKGWDSISQHAYHNQAPPKRYTHHLGYRFPRVLGFQVAEEVKGNTSNDCSRHSNEPSAEQENNKVVSTLTADNPQGASSGGLRVCDIVMKPSSDPCELKSHYVESSGSTKNGSASPKSGHSTASNLGLGMISSCDGRGEDKPVEQSGADLVHVDDPSRSNLSNCSSCSFLETVGTKEPKSLYRAIVERVGHEQEEAIASVVEVITGYQPKTPGFHRKCRGDIWIHLQGPDRVTKRKLGLALAEMLYGSSESFISVDLNFPDRMFRLETALYSWTRNKYDVAMRGTVVDYLVERLSKKPCVIFLENIDKSDHVVQNRLSRAVNCGRLIDLHGREANLSSSLFLATTELSASGCSSDVSREELPVPIQYSEEDILNTNGGLIQISIGFDLNDDHTCEDPPQILMNKRKIMSRSRNTDLSGSSEITKRANRTANSCLDLNLPANVTETSDSFSSGHSKPWIEDFDRQVDRIVIFKPFDFDTLAEKLCKSMTKCLLGIVRMKCALEIEPEVMQQLLAAHYLFGNKRVEEWIHGVLGQGLEEAMDKFSLNSHSVVKLASCEGSPEEGTNEDLLLPRKIIMV